MSELRIVDPAQIGQVFAEKLFKTKAYDEFRDNAETSHALVQAEQMAEERGFFDQKYFIQASRALLIPAQYEAGEVPPGYSFDGLSFTGEFKTYSMVRIGRIIGAGAVRAFCMTFNDVTLLPYLDHPDDDRLLHVPVHAIRDIDRFAA